jgi:uncharacterized protein YecE (DUF72 family)
MMAMIQIGTSGYSFEDWKGTFYPLDIKGGEMLEFYARHFKIVEINSTYYGIPRPEVFERMAEKTPSDFKFTVKANSGMTHDRKNNESVFDQFEAAIQPLVEADKFKGVLAQFPWSFKNTQENRKYLKDCRDHLANYPLIVEFRHISWISEPLFGFLREMGISYCAVDEPNLPGLVPPETPATGDMGYVRFHGRNKGTWWGGDASQRYNYLYTEQELKEWTPKINQLAASTQETYILFNNCHAGYAAKNAKMMQSILQPDLFKSAEQEDDKKEQSEASDS